MLPEAHALGTVRLAADLDHISVYADPLLEKVFYNLIDNALKHGGTLTEIRFATEEVNGDLKIICSDDGKGIPDSDKESIFIQRRGEHKGYGLYLAREILSITKLTIKETGTPGKGARFEISVPKGMYRGSDSVGTAPRKLEI